MSVVVSLCRKRNDLGVVVASDATPVSDVVVSASRVPVSVYVGLETGRWIQMLMRSENPEIPSPEPLPCVPYTPKNSDDLENKIFILASSLAAQIISLMNQHPGLEFGSIISVESDGLLTAQSFEMPTDHRTALNIAGINHARVVAMIHGHPKQPIGYPRPLYSHEFPSYGLMPSPRTQEAGADGVVREYGDWISYQYWIDQIASAGGRADLFRQYIVGFGSYDRAVRPRWHMNEPNAATRWTAEDYLKDPAGKRPTQSLPIGIVVEVCAE